MDLSKLGLTGNETKVYETLISLGKSSANQISAHSGVSHGRIYDILESLISKGLVQIVPGKTKKFITSDPKSLMKLLEKERRDLDDIEKGIEKLREKHKTKENEKIMVGYGKRAFYEFEKEMKKTESYNYNIRWNTDPNPEWVKNFKKYAKKGMDARHLVRHDKETGKNVKHWIKRGVPNIKEIENTGVAMSIKDDEEVMIALIDSNVTMLVRDKPFAKIMKKMYLETYKNAKEIKKL
jgi:sugar-specific transcriptional regulator TrmB